MYSLPNMIPLHPDAILGIWKSIANFKYKTTLGAFHNMEVYSGVVKQADSSLFEETGLELRMLESMKMIVKSMTGRTDHPLFKEQVSTLTANLEA